MPTIRAALTVLTLAAMLAAGCGDAEPPGGSATIRLLFTGDVMLGRNVAPVLHAEGVEALEAVRATVAAADVAVANLESPLTTRPYAGDGFDLRADPEGAAMLAAAGFDVLAVANNHAGDGGPGTVADTLAALDGAGLAAVGSGDALVLDQGGVTVAMLAYDLTRGGPDEIAAWGPEAEAEIAAARASASVVVVGIHGGAEGLPGPDPVLRQAVRNAAVWGADVVWAHGAHVPYPVDLIVADGGRAAVAAYGLGDLVFDRPGTGLLLEVLAGPNGVVAWRVAESRRDGPRPGRPEWRLPPGPAVALAGTWWALAADPDLRTAPQTKPPDVGGEVLAAAAGDVTGDGADEVVVAYLRPFRETLVNQAFPGVWVDANGRSAHLGVYRPSGDALWIAGTLAQPVTSLAVCDGALAVAYGHPDGTGPAFTGAWTWNGFGFALTPDLPGGGAPGCTDVDGDGRTDPVVAARAGPGS